MNSTGVCMLNPYRFSIQRFYSSHTRLTAVKRPYLDLVCKPL